MLQKDECLKAVRKFRAKYGLEATEENIIATVHLMNAHGLDVSAALDQSSRSSNDRGIDAWYYDEKKNILFIYQSKLSESKSLSLRGLNDLDNARQWIEQIIIDGTVDSIPNDNHCLFNLYTNLGNVRRLIKKITFILISLFDGNELEDSPEYAEFERKLSNSNLNMFIRDSMDGKLAVQASEYNLDEGVPGKGKIKVYPIDKIPNARVELRKNAFLDLAYVSLFSLVELFRQRGLVLFDKNIRLSLINRKEARERLVNPMENTLNLISSGKLSPNIFPFYHIGVTIAASSSTDEDNNLLNLQAPSIINGCQTIAIANEYLGRLETQRNEDAINLFKQIKVIAKVVVGITNEELKEITNSNNRQNPIENWQLFSNEPIHIEIEATLKDIGVFYERQKGKFDSVLKNADNAKFYNSTHGTYVGIVDLGQIISLARKNLQWAAKPSEIFLKKENHDQIFDRTIPMYPHDMIFGWNLYKAMRRGLNKYLELPTHANSVAPKIFVKPIIRANVFYLALLYFYQNDNKWFFRRDYSTSLTKIASTILVDEMQTFFQKVVSKIKNWYIEESKDLTVEVSGRRMKEFFGNLATDLGLDPSEGPIPFTKTAIDWREYLQNGQN